MPDHLRMNFTPALAAGRELANACSDYAAAGQHLRAGLSGAAGTGEFRLTGVPDSKLAGLLAEALRLLPEAAERTAQALKATADGMAEAVNNVHQAETATAAQIGRETHNR